MHNSLTIIEKQDTYTFTICFVMWWRSKKEENFRFNILWRYANLTCIMVEQNIYSISVHSNIFSHFNLKKKKHHNIISLISK